MLNIFKKRLKASGFVLMYKIGKRVYIGTNEFKVGHYGVQKVRQSFYCSATKEEALSNYERLRYSIRSVKHCQIIESSNLVLVEVLIFSGELLNPKAIEVKSVQVINKKEVDPDYQEPAYVAYVPKTSEEMTKWDTKVKIYSEAEFEAQEMAWDEVSAFNLNQFSPEFIQKMVNDRYDRVFSETVEFVEVNGKVGVLLTQNDGDDKNIDFVYNLKAVESFPGAGPYSSELYQKIDESKEAYVVYGVDAGVNDYAHFITIE